MKCEERFFANCVAYCEQGGTRRGWAGGGKRRERLGDRAPFVAVAGDRDGDRGDEREELAPLRRENQTLRIEREIVKKVAAFCARENRRAVGEIFALVEAERANFPVAVMCRVLRMNRTTLSRLGASRAVRSHAARCVVDREDQGHPCRLGPGSDHSISSVIGCE